MRIAHLRAERLLVAAMIGCVLFPLGLFVYTEMTLHDETRRQAESRIAGTLDGLSEHALKVFQSAELLLTAMQLQTAGLERDASEVRLVELHAAFKAMSQIVPEVQLIWVIARDGIPIVTSYVTPLPAVSVSDRDFFRMAEQPGNETRVGGILFPRLSVGKPFFTLSRRRSSADGRFDGVIGVSLLPDSFEASFSHLDGDADTSYQMVRSDGEVLAGLSTDVGGASVGGPMVTNWLQMDDLKREGGFLEVTGRDGEDRLIGYHKLPNYPVYVMVAIDSRSIRDQWLQSAAGHLAAGLPATLLILGALALAYRRTREAHAEAEARAMVEAALRQAQRLEAIGQLTGGIAHDFNNLLMIVQGGAERLESGLSDPRHRRSLELIEGAIRRGQTLTRQLLTFSRSQPMSVEVIDVAEHVRQFQDMLRRSLRGDVDITVETPSCPCAVKVDPGELDLALLNAGLNARDAIADIGRLTVTVATTTLTGQAKTDGLHGRFVTIAIADTGAGIPPDVLPKVFDPFFTTKTVGKGTGLGLSQVYGFARQSSGTVTIASEVGRGTTLTLYLPLTDEQVTPPAVQADPDPPESVRRALLVEDNPEVAEVCADFLFDLGFDVDCVADGQAALQRLQEGQHFDLVLSDVTMPGEISGIDLARALRLSHPTLPVLLTTGYASGEDESLRHEFPILRKPFDLSRLKEAIDRLLNAIRPEQARS